MKKLIFAVLTFATLAAPLRAGTGPSYGGIPPTAVIPVVSVATCSVVSVTTMSVTPIEVTGNPVYSSLISATNPPGPVYTTLHIQDADATADIYASYSSNVSTSTTPGIPGAGLQGMRICASSANVNQPPSCPSDQYFYVLPYQQFYLISGNTTAKSTAIVCKWR